MRISILFFLISLNLSAQTHYRVAKFEVPKMTCGGCANKVSQILSENNFLEENIFDIQADTNSQIITVKYDHTVLSHSYLLKQVELAREVIQVSKIPKYKTWDLDHIRAIAYYNLHGQDVDDLEEEL